MLTSSCQDRNRPTAYGSAHWLSSALMGFHWAGPPAPVSPCGIYALAILLPSVSTVRALPLLGSLGYQPTSHPVLPP